MRWRKNMKINPVPIHISLNEGPELISPRTFFTWFTQEFLLEEHSLHTETWMFMRWYFLSFFSLRDKIQWSDNVEKQMMLSLRWLSWSSVPRKPFLWDSPVSYSRSLNPWVWIYFWEMWSVTGKEKTPGMGRPGKRLQRRNISMLRRHSEVWLES